MEGQLEGGLEEPNLVLDGDDMSRCFALLKVILVREQELLTLMQSKGPLVLSGSGNVILLSHHRAT